MTRAELRAVARAEASWARWSSSFGTLVRRHVEQYVADDSDVEEIVQEVWITAWKHALGGGQANLRWLLRVVENKCRDDSRRVATRTRLTHELAVRASVSAVTPDELERFALLAALDSLKERDRHIIQLSFWNQCSAGEIAELLGMSQSAVRQRLHRSQVRLRKILGHERSSDLVGA